MSKPTSSHELTKVSLQTFLHCTLGGFSSEDAPLASRYWQDWELETVISMTNAGFDSFEIATRIPRSQKCISQCISKLRHRTCDRYAPWFGRIKPARVYQKCRLAA